MKKWMIILLLIFFITICGPKLHLSGSSQEEKFPLSFDLCEASKEINILIKRKERITKGVFPGCTIGELYVNGLYFCHTLERPFDDSENFISSVPPGKYDANLRYKKGKQQWRIQLESTMTYIFDQYDPFIIKGKTERNGIQIHPGVRPEHTKGCILVGEKGTESCRLCHSKETFERLLKEYFGSSLYPNQNLKITVIIRNDYSKH